MGHWGVRSYENDDAADALDAGFDRVHGATYEEMMDDRNPLTPDQIETEITAVHDLAIAGFQASADWAFIYTFLFLGFAISRRKSPKQGPPPIVP